MTWKSTPDAPNKSWSWHLESLLFPFFPFCSRAGKRGSAVLKVGIEWNRWNCSSFRVKVWTWFASCFHKILLLLLLLHDIALSIDLSKSASAAWSFWTLPIQIICSASSICKDLQSDMSPWLYVWLNSNILFFGKTVLTMSSRFTSYYLFTIYFPFRCILKACHQ